jgi:hypothetical protein
MVHGQEPEPKSDEIDFLGVGRWANVERKDKQALFGTK